MECENYEEYFEMSDVEDELDFAMHADNGIFVDNPGNISETDSDDSDVIIVRKKQKIQIIESDSEDINKPKAVVNYTNSMGGVDQADQYASSYCFLSKKARV